MPDPATAAAPPGATDATGALAAAQAQITNYQSQLVSLRKSADLSGKTLAGLATSAATALGVTKLASVFPQPPGAGVGWFIVMYGGLAAALVGVGVVAVRLWRVARPIPSRSDPIRMKSEAGLDGPELRLVCGVYDDMAALNGVRSLLVYEARGHRLERVADRMQPLTEPLTQAASHLRSQAAIIAAEVHAAQARATYLVARRRAARVFTDPWALVAYTAFIAGIVALSLGSSYLSARSTDPSARFTLARDCLTLKYAATKAGTTIEPSTPGCSHYLGGG